MKGSVLTCVSGVKENKKKKIKRKETRKRGERVGFTETNRFISYCLLG